MDRCGRFRRLTSPSVHGWSCSCLRCSYRPDLIALVRVRISDCACWQLPAALAGGGVEALQLVLVPARPYSNIKKYKHSQKQRQKQQQKQEKTPNDTRPRYRASMLPSCFPGAGQNAIYAMALIVDRTVNTSGAVTGQRPVSFPH
ncbi:hypothetical protein CI102_6717 [Trichoderma harzianum]|nr:hypothetical protein CI102_6717 [Trichoderma harzianum]